MNWYVWRIVLSKIATLEEIETHWSLLDLVQANYALDTKTRIEKEAIEAAKRK